MVSASGVMCDLSLALRWPGCNIVADTNANEAMAEFFELDGRPEDAREARKAAKAEWREAAKDDREALKLIESELVERELIERAGGAA